MSMAVELGKVAILFVLMLAQSGQGSYIKKNANNHYCNFYTPEVCDGETSDIRCSQGSRCDPVPNRNSYCYITWSNNTAATSGHTLEGTSPIKVLRRGCWGTNSGCEGKNECVEDRDNPGEYFCCCSGDYCNTEPSYRPSGQTTDTPDDPGGGGSVLCEAYKRDCPEDELDCNKTIEYCPPENDKTSHCYATWKNNSGVLEILMKGCWLNHPACYQDACVEHDPDQEVYFCCCSGDMCNSDFELRPTPQSERVTEQPPEERASGSPLVKAVLYSIIPLIVVAILVATSFYLWRRHQRPSHEQLPTVDPSPILPAPPSPNLGLRPVQLLEVKARGRFGCVWKARMLDREVAVKVFPIQDRQSWMTERDVYLLPQMAGHDNILQFVTAEMRGDACSSTGTASTTTSTTTAKSSYSGSNGGLNGLSMDLWLITEYHERGSLYDYLKGNLITWPELLKIAESMTGGVAFMHEDQPAVDVVTLAKPAIAHRDFKSRNVLLKHDLTACVADFGLALVFENGKSIGDTHGQVGTRRYMAPEVLEGAINFSRDAFLRIDMYAVGLVLWELMSRCSIVDGPVEDYQLPFEEEVGQHPTLEDIQEVVVQQKQRPRLKELWLNNPNMTALWNTVEECWDQDPDARLSAGCVKERLALYGQAPPANGPLSVVVMTNQQTPPKESSI